MEILTEKELNDMSIEELKRLDDKIYEFWNKIRTVVKYKELFKRN